MIRPALAPLALSCLAASAAAQSPHLPGGFVSESIGGDWRTPVGLCYLDEHRLLVAEKRGTVWLVQDDVKRNLVLDLRGETLDNGDRGLLGITADPDFAANGRIYVLYVVDPNGGANLHQPTFSRLVRYETRTDPLGALVALPGSRLELLGAEWSTGIPACHTSHSIGTLRFLSDGSLVLSAGDGAHFDATDVGGLDPDCFGDGRFPLDQDVGSLRSQYENTLAGKVLRIDPGTGLGLADNPYFTGDPLDLRSRIWALGLRNPFRFTLLPGSGPQETLFISDVGWNRWEEIDVCRGGENFGWPCFEGRGPQGEYRGADPFGFCLAASAVHAPPLLTWNHSSPGTLGFTGSCATGLAFYGGSSYPPLWRGRLFFFDYTGSWLKAARLDEDQALVDIVDFGTFMGSPVDLVIDPATGDLVFASLSGAGTGVRRIRYVGSNQPPVAIATATPEFGPAPLQLTLSAGGSYDPEGDALTFTWDLGDGTSANGSEVVHVYPDPAQNYSATLVATDPEERSTSARVLITPGNTPPGAAILAPAGGALYDDGEPIKVVGSATDGEDGSPRANWTLDLVHDHHVHPQWATAEGELATLFPGSHGEEGDHHYLLTLRATDSRGLADERTIELYRRDSEPQAHIVGLSDDRLRLGQVLEVTCHVDFARSRLGGKLPALALEWGDGSVQSFPDAADQVDFTPEHVYAGPGRYELRCIAELDGKQSVATAEVEVEAPRSAVALFAPLFLDYWVNRTEQEETAAALSGSAPEVQVFHLGEGGELSSWMETYLDDHVQDVVVLLDFVPEALFAGEADGSLAERWLERGNAIVWSGQTPFAEAVRDDGSTFSTGPSSSGAAAVLDSSNPELCLGKGIQELSDLARRELPSLQGYNANRALRYDALGPEWRVRKIYAQDGDRDSDDLVIEHVAGGFFAQFLCRRDLEFSRAAVLQEFLAAELGRARSRPGPAGPPRVR